MAWELPRGYFNANADQGKACSGSCSTASRLLRRSVGYQVLSCRFDDAPCQPFSLEVASKPVKQYNTHECNWFFGQFSDTLKLHFAVKQGSSFRCEILQEFLEIKFLRTQSKRNETKHHYLRMLKKYRLLGNTHSVYGTSPPGVLTKFPGQLLESC